MSVRKQRGFGLVELMVACTVGVIILGVIGSVYDNTKQVARVNDTISRLQENGRFAVQLLDRDVRMAGFRGCGGVTIAPVNVLDTTSYFYQYDVSLTGSHGTGSAFTPAPDASVLALSATPVATGDVVTIRYIDGPGIPLSARMASATDVLQVSPGSPIGAGDLLLVADCSSSAMFRATSVDATGAIGHDTTSANSPKNTTANLGQIFGTDASVYRLVTKTYYIAASARKANTNSLWSNSVPAYDGTPQPVEMVEGVERFLVLYGEDLDGDQAANRYVTAESVVNWSNVVSTKALLLLATTTDGMAMSPQPYKFNGTTTTPTDRKLRLSLTSLITLRNRTP
jgi:type IV pilus assembly protein PilW